MANSRTSPISYPAPPFLSSRALSRLLFSPNLPTRYLAATRSFTTQTDVVLLCTNMLKKTFQSSDQYEVGQAINCLANIATKDLARDLMDDVLGTNMRMRRNCASSVNGVGVGG